MPTNLLHLISEWPLGGKPLISVLPSHSMTLTTSCLSLTWAHLFSLISNSNSFITYSLTRSSCLSAIALASAGACRRDMCLSQVFNYNDFTATTRSASSRVSTIEAATSSAAGTPRSSAIATITRNTPNRLAASASTT